VKKISILCRWKGSGERLIEMVVGIYQPRENQIASQIEDFVRFIWKRIGGANLLYPTISSEEGTVMDLPSLSIHRDQHGGMSYKERGHGPSLRPVREV
jgi:hypothetical protein